MQLIQFWVACNFEDMSLLILLVNILHFGSVWIWLFGIVLKCFFRVELCNAMIA